MAEKEEKKGQLYVKDPKTGEMVPFDENRLLQSLKRAGGVPVTAAKEISKIARDAAVGGVVSTLDLEKIVVDYLSSLVVQTADANRKLADVLRTYVRMVGRVKEEKK